MVVVGTNPDPASDAANDTSSAAGEYSAKTGMTQSAVDTAREGAGELEGFTGGCDDFESDLVSSLQGLENQGVDTGDALGESAADATETDGETSDRYRLSRPLTGAAVS